MFIRTEDYEPQITTEDLGVITNNTLLNRERMELTAQKEITTYLSQRYSVSNIFNDILNFGIGTTYSATNLIMYTGVTAFSASTVYSTGNRVTYSGKIYKSIAGSAAHAFSQSEWTLICDDRTLFYAKIPSSATSGQYDAKVMYAVDSLVWYNNGIYKALQTVPLSHFPVIYPQYWELQSTYSFSGFYPENTTYWTQGDNRNELILLYCIDIAIYHLHTAVNARNIPELRWERYQRAVQWLKAVASGDVNAGLPELLPSQGLSIQWGSSPRNTSKY